MEPKKHNQHTHIEKFNPDVKMLYDSYQDFFCQMKEFNAGVEYQNFNDFVINEASEYAASGDGVTYIVWNVFSDAVPKAVEFYLRNGFQFLLENMTPFYSLDAEFTPMFLSLYELHINYDD